jgi:heme/copper-type cytochrome/quinol oxidase subunit 2
MASPGCGKAFAMMHAEAIVVPGKNPNACIAQNDNSTTVNNKLFCLLFISAERC